MICAPPQPPLPPKIKKWHIAYDLPLAEYGICTKFGSDRSKGVDFYKEHTNILSALSQLEHIRLKNV